MESYESSRRKFLTTSASGVLVLSTGDSLAQIMESKSVTVSGTGTNLSKLHNDVYRDFIKQLETHLQNGNRKITSYNGYISRNKVGIYTLKYSVTSTPSKIGEKSHKHVELNSSVWSEKGKGKKGAISNHARRTVEMDRKWKGKFYGVQTFNHASGDDDLYQIGKLYLAQ